MVEKVVLSLFRFGACRDSFFVSGAKNSQQHGGHAYPPPLEDSYKKKNNKNNSSASSSGNDRQKHAFLLQVTGKLRIPTNREEALRAVKEHVLHIIGRIQLLSTTTLVACWWVRRIYGARRYLQRLLSSTNSGGAPSLVSMFFFLE